MIITNFNAEGMGKWQTLYWNKGPKAAAAYCKNVVIKLAGILNSVIYPLCLSQKDTAHFQECEVLRNGYELKASHYQPDVCFGGSLRSAGRNEPGRTPFNYPDFRHKYSTIQSLNEHFDKKITHHQEMLISIQILLKNLPVEIPERQYLELLKKDQIRTLRKWQRRKASKAQFSSWILSSGRNPLNVTSIDWAHQHGYYGENGEIIVLENKGADVTHPFLADSFLNSSIPVPAGSHGTHISGIIAAQKNESNGHSGAAPGSKIQLALGSPPELSRIIQESPIPFVNFSGDCPNLFSELITNFNKDLEFGESLIHVMSSVRINVIMQKLISISQLRQQGEIDKAREVLQQMHQLTENINYQNLSSMFQGKLVITAIGNDGVMITASPRYQTSCSSQMKIIKDAGIYAVNLQSDGLTPYKWSNLPGHEYADCTVCAVGHEVVSCLPEGDYGKKTGTSMAAPFVSSVAVLLKSAFPGLSNAQIRSCILDSATPIVLDLKGKPHLVESPADLNHYTQEQIHFSKQFFGKGLLNAKGAIELAKSLHAPDLGDLGGSMDKLGD